MKRFAWYLIFTVGALFVVFMVACEKLEDPFSAKNVSPIIRDFRFQQDPGTPNIRSDSLKFKPGKAYALLLEYEDPEFQKANRTLRARFKFISGSGKIRHQAFKKPSADSLTFAEVPATFKDNLFFTPDSAGIVIIEFGLSDGVKESVARLDPSAKFFNNLAPIPSFTTRFLQQNNPYRIECNPASSVDRDGEIITAIWRFGDNTPPVTVQGKTIITHDYPLSGQYLVRLQMIDNDGAIGSREQFVTTLNQAPQAALSVSCLSADCQVGPQPATDISGSAPLQIKYDAGGSLDPDGSVASYLINFGDGETAQNDSGSHTYISDGIDTVKLTVTDNLGLATTTRRIVTVATPPIAKLKVTPTQGSFPLPCTIDADSSRDPFGGALSYQIFIDDQLRYTQSKVTHVFDIPKVSAYLIRLEVANQRNQLRSIANEAVFVNNTPPVADFTYTPPNPQATVQIRFTSTSFDPNPTDTITNYRWNWGDGAPEEAGSDLSTAVHSYAAGEYTVTLIVTDRFNGTGEKKMLVKVGTN